MENLNHTTTSAPEGLQCCPPHLTRTIIKGVYEFREENWLPGDHHYLFSELSSTRSLTFFEDNFRKEESLLLDLDFDYEFRLFTSSENSPPLSAFMWKKHGNIYCGVDIIQSEERVIFELVPSDSRLICFHADIPLPEFIRRFNNRQDEEMQRDIERARDLLVSKIFWQKA